MSLKKIGKVSIYIFSFSILILVLLTILIVAENKENPKINVSTQSDLSENKNEEIPEKTLNIKVDDIKKSFSNIDNFEFETINSNKIFGSFNFEDSPLYMEIFHDKDRFIEEINCYIYIDSETAAENLLKGNTKIALWHTGIILLLSMKISENEESTNKISRWIAQAVDSIDRSGIKKTYSKDFNDKNISVTKYDTKGHFYIIKVKPI